MVFYLSKQSSVFFDVDVRTDISIKDVLEMLKDKPVLALDCETNSMFYKTKNIIMLQFGTPEFDQIVIDVRDYPVELFKDILNDPNKTFIGHNIRFDYNMLKPYKILLRNVYDTMIAENVLYNGMYNAVEAMKAKRYSLAGVYKHYFGEDVIKSVRDEFHTVGSKPYTHSQVMYGANDVLYPFQIKEEQERLISQYELQNCIRLENKLVLVVGDMEHNGLHINKNKWRNITIKYSERLKKTTKELDDLLLQCAPQYKIDAFQQDLFNAAYMDTRECKVNWSSDKQVYDILKNIYGIRPVDKHGKPSSGAEAIRALKKNYPITDLILRYREEEKVITSFGIDYLGKYVSDDSRIRTTYNQVIETGRMSSRKPNLQQIPNYDEDDLDTRLFREAFEAPDGKVISTADYAQQEARIMADKSGDENYINFFKTGDGDIHSFVATVMFSASFGKKFVVTKDNKNKAYRYKGKIINFFISFGGSAYTLSRTLKIPEKEAQELIDAFYKGFPSLRDMFEESKRFALDNGFIRTNNVTNRIRWFKEWSEYKRLKQIPYELRTNEDRSKFVIIRGNIERRAMNTPIQGTAGDMTKAALVILRDRLLKENVLPFEDAPVKIVNVVHDECSLEMDKDLAEKYTKIQQESMEQAGRTFVHSMEVPAEPTVEKYWCH